VRSRLDRRGAGLVEAGNRDAGDPGGTGEQVGVARIDDGNGAEIVRVEELGELCEPGAGDRDIGGGKREGQPLRGIQPGGQP